MRFVLLSAYSASVYSAFYGTYSPTTASLNKFVGEYPDVHADSGFLSAPQIKTTPSPYTTENDSFYDSHKRFPFAEDPLLDRVYRDDYYDDLNHILYNDPADHIPAIDLDEEGRFLIRSIEV